MDSTRYENGNKGMLLDKDGCGFLYYKSGRVAICISKISDYQRRHYAYEDSSSKCLLFSMDEHAVGAAGKYDKRLVLTKDGGLLSDGNNTLLKTWRWDTKSQNAGSLPTEVIKIELNSSMVFHFRNRQDVLLSFSHEGIQKEFQCGERVLRRDTYLDHSSRSSTVKGKWIVEGKGPTLIQRTKQIQMDSLEKRSKQKPKSKDIDSEKIKNVIKQLETTFDNYGKAYQVKAAPDPGWRQTAKEMTIAQVPLIEPSGSEVGTKPSRFGQSTNFDKNKTDVERSIKLLRSDSNAWLDSLQVRERLDLENPALRRSAALSNASGRYSKEIQVPGGQPCAKGKQLTRIHGPNFDEFIKLQAPRDQIVLIACIRADDRACRKAEHVLQIANEEIQNGTTGAPTEKARVGLQYDAENDSMYKIVKFEMTESSFLAKKYNIQAVPTFLIFYKGKLVDKTALGGAALRVNPTTKNANLVHLMNHPPRTLVIQPEFKHQIKLEKILKKEDFTWDLAMTGEEGATHTKRLYESSSKGGSSTGQVYDLLLLSDKITTEDLRIIERCIYRGGKSAKAASSPLIICLMVTKGVFKISKNLCSPCRASTGKRTSNEFPTPNASEVCPRCSIVSDAISCIDSEFRNLVDAVVYNQPKAATLHRLAELWNNKKQSIKAQHEFDPSYKGMTLNSVFQQLEQSLTNGRRGRYYQKNAKPERASIETSLNNQINS